MRPKSWKTSVSRNILSILVRLSTGTELHQNGNGRRWYEVRQISAICIQLDIFGESHFDLFYSSFSSLRSFNFLLFLIEYSISFWHHCTTVKLHSVYLNCSKVKSHQLRGWLVKMFMLFLPILEPKFSQGLSSILHKQYAFGPRSGEMKFRRNENTTDLKINGKSLANKHGIFDDVFS